MDVARECTSDHVSSGDHILDREVLERHSLLRTDIEGAHLHNIARLPGPVIPLGLRTTYRRERGHLRGDTPGRSGSLSTPRVLRLVRMRSVMKVETRPVLVHQLVLAPP